jgi:hypothetical protein
MTTIGAWPAEELIGEGKLAAAEAIQRCVGLALGGLRDSDIPWDHGVVLIVIESEGGVDIGLAPPEKAIQAAPWLDDGQRALVMERLPLDERRIAAISVEGHVSTMVYLVPGGTMSN